MRRAVDDRGDLLSDGGSKKVIKKKKKKSFVLKIGKKVKKGKAEPAENEADDGEYEVSCS